MLTAVQSMLMHTMDQSVNLTDGVKGVPKGALVCTVASSLMYQGISSWLLVKDKWRKQR
jgi:hypothetical protein